MKKSKRKAFKKSKKQLKASTGKSGPVVTAQEDLFKGLVGNELSIKAKIIEGKVNLKTKKNVLIYVTYALVSI